MRVYGTSHVDRQNTVRRFSVDLLGDCSLTAHRVDDHFGFANCRTFLLAPFSTAMAAVAITAVVVSLRGCRFILGFSYRQYILPMNRPFTIHAARFTGILSDSCSFCLHMNVNIVYSFRVKETSR